MKNIFISLLLASFVFLIGCEDDSSSNKTLEESGTVTAVSQPKFEGDVIEFVLDNDTIVRVRSNTSIRRQRESCSGFNASSASEIRNGDFLEFTYLNPDGVDYANETYIAKHIDAYRAECVAEPESVGAVILLDTDKDGTPDKYDADPEDPEVQ